jgi:hypothetical protein
MENLPASNMNRQAVANRFIGVYSFWNGNERMQGKRHNLIQLFFSRKGKELGEKTYWSQNSRKSKSAPRRGIQGAD